MVQTDNKEGMGIYKVLCSTDVIQWYRQTTKKEWGFTRYFAALMSFSGTEDNKEGMGIYKVLCSTDVIQWYRQTTKKEWGFTRYFAALMSFSGTEDNRLESLN